MAKQAVSQQLGPLAITKKRADLKSMMTAPQGFRDTTNDQAGNVKDTVNGARGVGAKRAARLISPVNKTMGSRITVRSI